MFETWCKYNSTTCNIFTYCPDNFYQRLGQHCTVSGTLFLFAESIVRFRQSNAITAISLLLFPAMLSHWQVLCCLHKAMRCLEVTSLEEKSSCQILFCFMMVNHILFTVYCIDWAIEFISKILIVKLVIEKLRYFVAYNKNYMCI